MEVVELLPSLRELNRHDKLRVMQFLVSELADEENNLIQAGESYPVWSPHSSFDAANTLLETLREDRHV